VENHFIPSNEHTDLGRLILAERDWDKALEAMLSDSAISCEHKGLMSDNSEVFKNVFIIGYGMGGNQMRLLECQHFLQEIMELSMDGRN
jgi:hypothetical protein